MRRHMSTHSSCQARFINPLLPCLSSFHVELHLLSLFLLGISARMVLSPTRHRNPQALFSLYIAFIFYQIWHARITTERSTEKLITTKSTRILLNIATMRQYHNRVHKYILGQHYLEASRSTRQESINKHKNLVQEKGSGTASTQCPQSPPSGMGTTSPSEAFDPKPLMSPYVYQSQIESAYVFLCLSYQSAQIPKSYGAFEGGTDEEREVELTLMVL